MARPTTAEISLSAICHNFRLLLGLTPKDTAGIAVVKADAYGHGAVPVARALADAGVCRFAVALVEEALALADAAVPGAILILGYPTADDAETIVARNLESVVSSLGQARHLNRAAAARRTSARVHLKFDTGMGRVGFPLDRAVHTVAQVRALTNLRVQGVMTHCPSPDEEDAAEFTNAQIAAFRDLKSALDNHPPPIPLWHAAGSAAILYYPASHFNAVRPGIALYGCYPSPRMPRPLPLRQAMTLATRIASIRNMPAGAAISYGRTWRTPRPSRIALLPIGYADGFDRRLSNRGHVLVRGRRAPVVGRICMDLSLVDVTDIPDAREDDPVVLYGTQGGESISVEEVAAALELIPHVLLCAVSARVPRTYPPPRK